MISKSVLKPKPLASQKVRRRWVFSYIISFSIALLSIVLVGWSYVETAAANNFFWMSLSIFIVSMLAAVVAFVRLLSSDYAVLARTPISKLDERQVLVHYRATEICFHTLSIIFCLIAVYVFFIQIMGLPLLNQNALAQFFGTTATFITGLKIAMIAWLEPDLIEEAPAKIASA